MKHTEAIVSLFNNNKVYYWFLQHTSISTETYQLYSPGFRLQDVQKLTGWQLFCGQHSDHVLCSILTHYSYTNFLLLKELLPFELTSKTMKLGTTLNELKKDVLECILH